MDPLLRETAGTTERWVHDSTAPNRKEVCSQIIGQRPSIIRQGPPYEPGPPQGFFMSKGSFRSPLFLVLGPGPVSVIATDPLSIKLN